jgi:hypothetical protein
METEKTEGEVDTTNNEGEGEAKVEEETIAIPKKEYDTLNQTLGSLKREVKDLKKVNDKPKEETPPSKPAGELDDTQLDYLDLKGITEEEDIAVIKSVMAKTGQTVRQALKDDYVVAKLKDLKVSRDVKAATPSATKRSGQQPSDNEDYWFQKYEASGELPKGMPAGMASKLIDRKASQDDVHTPKFAR